MMDIKLDYFFCKVWSRHLSLPPSASALDLVTLDLVYCGWTRNKAASVRGTCCGRAPGVATIDLLLLLV